MKQNKKMVNKQRLAFFQILVLMVGIISFSYLVGAQETTGITSAQWTSICDGIANSNNNAGSMNIDAVKTTLSPLNLGVAVQVINTIDEKSLVENCAGNLNALKKLDDKTFFTGTNKIDFTNFDNKQKIFEEVSRRISVSVPSSSNTALKEFNLAQNYNIRGKWLKNLNIESDGTNQPPQIISYKSDTKILNLGEKDKWKRTIDTKSLETNKIKIAVSENGGVTIKDGINAGDGTTITGNGNAEIKYENGLKITAEKDTIVDLSKTDFSPGKPYSVNVISKDAIVKTSDADYSGIFEGKFTESSREFTNIGTDGMFIGEDGGNKQSFFSGQKMIINNKEGIVNTIDGKFREINFNAETHTIQSPNAFISRGNRPIPSEPNALNVKLNDDGLVTDAVLRGSGKQTITASTGVDGRIDGFKNLNIDTSQATDGELILEVNGKSVKLENGKILKGEDLKEILADGGSLTYKYSPQLPPQILTNRDGTIQTKISDTQTGQVSTPEKSGLRKVWDKYKWPIILVAGAAAALGAFLLFKKKKDSQKEKDKEKEKDKKKNESKNSSK